MGSEIQGRVLKIRKTKKYIFYIIENSHGQHQVISHRENDLKINSRDVVNFTGNEQESGSYKFNSEFFAQEAKITSKNLVGIPYSYKDKPLEEYDPNNRIYQLSNPNIRDLLRAKSEIIHKTRIFLKSKEHIEVTSPTIVPSHVEGKTQNFGLDYYGDCANLTISNILYHQMLISADFLNIFEIGKLFRKNDAQRKTHLDEFSVLDITQAYVSGLEYRTFIGDLLTHLYSNCLEKDLNIDEISYDDALNFLNKNDFNIKWGQGHQLPQQSTKLLNKYIGSDLFWIINYPFESKAFFDKKSISGERQYAKSFELWGNLYANIGAGGERIETTNELRENLQQKGLYEKNFKDYNRALEFGSPPSVGMGIGLDRLIAEMLKLKDLRTLNPFPRIRNKRLI